MLAMASSAISSVIWNRGGLESSNMDDIVYLNGSLMPISQARISILDYGFLYGYGLFETMRAYQGRVFRLDSHLSRLTASAEMLGFSVAVIDLRKAIADVIDENRLGNARIRITVSIGEGAMSPDPASCDKPTVLIMATDYHPYPESVYQAGFRAIVSSIHRNSQSPISRFKSTSYLESLLARQEARDAGINEAILLNDKGYVAEASMSNVFLVNNDTVITPSEDGGILPGITRAVILEISQHLDIENSGRNITLEELISAEEAFLTNSVMEIMPLTEINGITIGTGIPGTVTRSLMAAYRQLVQQELGIP
jgi:branched-chain amino acid aminotransferase group I